MSKQTTESSAAATKGGQAVKYMKCTQVKYV